MNQHLLFMLLCSAIGAFGWLLFWVDSVWFTLALYPVVALVFWVVVTVLKRRLDALGIDSTLPPWHDGIGWAYWGFWVTELALMPAQWLGWI